MRSNATNIKKTVPGFLQTKSPRLSGKLWLEKSVNLVIIGLLHSIGNIQSRSIAACIQYMFFSFFNFIDWVDRDETHTNK